MPLALAALIWAIPGWDRDAYVLIPAAAYDGNRAFTRVAPVAPDYGAWYDTADFGSGRCPAVMHEKIPALAPDGSGVLEGAAGDLSTPCVAVFLPKARKGCIYWFEPQVCGVDTGFCLSNGTLRIECPARDREFLFRSVRKDRAPRGGEPVVTREARVRLDEFPCADVPSFYAAFFARRKSFVSDPREPIPSASERRRLADLVVRRMVADSIRDVLDRGMTWSVGWCGGPMNIAAMANVKHPDAVRMAAVTLDFMADTQSPCGLFRGLSKDGEIQPERPSRADSAGLHLLRRSADALFYAFDLLDLAGETPRRKASLVACADAFAAIFEREGELPQYVDQRTGASRIAGSTSAAIAPAALVRTFRRFGDARHLAAAERIAEQMWTTYVSRGLSFGGPGDAGDACDSESIYAFLESCVALAEAGRNAKVWTARAETAAHILSTWIVPYRYEFPSDSEYGRRGVNTVGSVVANLQNRHAAPGFCTASGDALVRLAKLTGNAAYRELYLDVVSFFPQVVSTPEHPITARLWTDTPRALDPGAINERVNMSGWEGLKGVGEVFPGPCWSELSFLLIPGLVDEELKL